MDVICTSPQSCISALFDRLIGVIGFRGRGAKRQPARKKEDKKEGRIILVDWGILGQDSTQSRYSSGSAETITSNDGRGEDGKRIYRAGS